ncbi:hypothetical protein ACFQ88_10950 [Paenibacillus sp. NPDC056579]|uniref:hypothetical protein n=1 Tax=Paenibacillus sp. NPDC056579 TaxID=3345871 RepID=UPI0036C71240
MNELVNKIIMAVADLSDTEKETLIIALTEHFGEEVEFFEKLTMFDPADLEKIHSSVYGMVITKKVFLKY